ncbi:hypothetical protein AAG570_009968 [Ranatra chinensis]|uniref:G-protein coupled receptors family 2 profile 1 domain-containing protein n=1 Tax=Ranatra chinensis TaxID=642074 RepID=A0ABD0YQM4_9HEMI
MSSLLVRTGSFGKTVALVHVATETEPPKMTKQVWINEETTDYGEYCDAVFDGWSCWPPTEAGSTAYAPCPHFITGFDPNSKWTSLHCITAPTSHYLLTGHWRVALCHGRNLSVRSERDIQQGNISHLEDDARPTPPDHVLAKTSVKFEHPSRCVHEMSVREDRVGMEGCKCGLGGVMKSRDIETNTDGEARAYQGIRVSCYRPVASCSRIGPKLVGGHVPKSQGGTCEKDLVASGDTAHKEVEEEIRAGIGEG